MAIAILRSGRVKYEIAIVASTSTAVTHKPVRRDEVRRGTSNPGSGAARPRPWPARYSARPTRSTPCGRSRRPPARRRSQRGRSRCGAGARARTTRRGSTASSASARDARAARGPTRHNNRYACAARAVRSARPVISAHHELASHNHTSPISRPEVEKSQTTATAATSRRPTGITTPSAPRCCNFAAVAADHERADRGREAGKERDPLHARRTRRTPRARSPGPRATASWSRPRCAHRR